LRSIPTSQKAGFLPRLADRRWWLIGCFASLGIVVLGGIVAYRNSAISQVADTNDAAAVALGERVYAENCASCHGANLEGQPNWQQRLPDGTMPAPPHDETGHTWHHPDRMLFEYTKFGGAAVVPEGFKSAMTGFGETLTDAEIWAVLAFIKAQWPPEIQEVQARRNSQ